MNAFHRKYVTLLQVYIPVTVGNNIDITRNADDLDNPHNDTGEHNAKLLSKECPAVSMCRTVGDICNCTHVNHTGECRCP